MPSPNDVKLNSPFDFLKKYCYACGGTFWFGHKCTASSAEQAACLRNLNRQVVDAEAKKHGSATGLGLKDCPICHGKVGNWNCRLCDGNGKVPENMF